MPQTSMFPSVVPEMGRLTLITETWPLTTQADEYVITAKIDLSGRLVPSIMVWTLTGSQRDYYATLVSEVTSAWRWGETPREVWRAGNDIVRIARQHARSADY